jgi:hypothetical protein
VSIVIVVGRLIVEAKIRILQQMDKENDENPRWKREISVNLVKILKPSYDCGAPRCAR